MVCVREWLSPDSDSRALTERREDLLDLYLQSLSADERAGVAAGHHRLSAGVLKLVLETLDQEQAQGQ